MPAFTYSAVGNDGKQTSGTLDARDREEAFRKLSQMKLQPFALNPATTGSLATLDARRLTKSPAEGKAAAREASASSGKIRLNGKQLALFTEELSDLLQAGLQLEQALKVMENREDKSAVKEVAAVIRAKVRDGSSFAHALRTTSPSFSELYCNLASAGELSGSLGTILQRQTDYLKTMAELRSKVTTAMIYPSFLFVSGILVTVVFVTFLIPKLMALIGTTGGDPPLAAVVLMALSGFFKQYGWLLLAAIGALLVAGRMFVAIPANRPVWDRMKLRFPLLGPLQLTRFHVQILETLANVMGNGLDQLKALELAKGTTTNLFLRGKIEQATAEVGDGASLSRAFHRTGVFPAMLIDLIRVGEQTGHMEESLAKAAERFDKELSTKIDKVSAMVQPMIVVLMAGLVGTMAYIMISIIYETISMLRTR